MALSDTTYLAIGGGDIAHAPDICDTISESLKRHSDPRAVVMTIATSEAAKAAKKYSALFRKLGAAHVDIIDVDDRENAFEELAQEKVAKAHVIFFTGGDQNMVPALLGGSPLHEALTAKLDDGILLVGTSAGAAMMSGSMISGGESKTAPKVGAVKIAPGMNFLPGTVIDTHFSQRGRHGRLLTAMAHDPQLLGIGLDEQTGILVEGSGFTVVGLGSVMIFDGRRMTYSNLVYRKDNEAIAMFKACVHVLPEGYSFDLKTREPKAPPARSHTARG